MPLKLPHARLSSALRWMPVLFIITALAPLQGCRDDDDHEDTPLPTDTTSTSHGKRIVLHYMAAQNSLGAPDSDGWSYAHDDLNEMLEGSRYLAEGDTLAVLVDDDDLPRIYAFYRNCTAPLTLYTFSSDINTADPASLKTFLTWAAARFGSEIYGLGVGTHANGWIPSSNTQYYAPSKFSIGIDTGPGGNLYSDRDANGNLGAQMNVTDFAQAIEESGISLHYLFFDCCLMQNVETAYALRHTADYIVASPMSINVYGANYTHLMQNGLFSDHIEDIAATYFADVTDPAQQSKYQDYGLVISVVNTAELEALAACAKQVVVPHFNSTRSYNLDSTLHYYYYDRYYYYTIPHYFDALSGLEPILTADEMELWRRQLNLTVAYRHMSPRILLGPYLSDFVSVDSAYCAALSMFLPQTSYALHGSRYNFNEQFRQTEWYQAAGWADTGW